MKLFIHSIFSYIKTSFFHFTILFFSVFFLFRLNNEHNSIWKNDKSKFTNTKKKQSFDTTQYTNYISHFARHMHNKLKNRTIKNEKWKKRKQMVFRRWRSIRFTLTNFSIQPCSGHNPTRTRCQPGEFECKDITHECIPMAMVCDGINDCTDRSDELNCVDVDQFVRQPNRTKKDEASKSANIIGLFTRKKHTHTH